MPKQVTFSTKRTGGKVTVRELIDVLGKAMKWLRTLDPDSPVEWEVIKIKMGERLSLTFNNPQANGAVTSGMGELRSLQQKRKPKIAPRLSSAVIESTKELAEVLGTGFESLMISSPGVRAVKVTPNLVHRVTELSKPTPIFRTEWTTIEGVMDQVTVESNKSRFRIAHPLTGEEISCTFDQGVVNLEDVKQALPHRVAVYGRAKLDRMGKTTSIEVSKLVQLRDESEFPRIASMPSIDIAGGMDPADYVERVRGGE